MSLYRSEDMIRCQLFLQTDALYQSVANLGEIGAIQFLDLNENVHQFKRMFTNEIRRVDELQRKLRFFENQLKKLGKELPESEDYPSTPPPIELIEMETKFEAHENVLKELSNNVDTLERHYMEMLELYSVLEKSEEFFLEVRRGRNSSTRRPSEVQPKPIVNYEPLRGTHRGSMWYSTGVVPFDRISSFYKTVWLSSHGNTILHFVEGPLPSKTKAGVAIEKSVFIAICQSEQLQKQLEQIAKGYKATIYPCPKTIAEREDMLDQVQQRITDLEIIIQKSKEQIDSKLQVVCKSVYIWRIKLIKMKACYFTLNMFQPELHGYIAEGYVPVCELKNVQAAITSANESVGNKEPPVINPVKSATLPTYFRTNHFTLAFQVIIDSYGVARYKEINPAFFSIISFPFLFSVMFGDAGHGLVLFAFGLSLCIWEKKLLRPASTNEIYRIIFGGRYMVMVMGLFSIYAGFMYNDFFSKPVNIFGSKYDVIYDSKTLLASKSLQIDASDSKIYHGVPYPLGIDPMWELAENEITYMNSFKKKISVIFGISQMTLGVILSLLNHLYFGNYVGVFCEFIPMILFLTSIFWYMCGIIITKWLLLPSSSDPQVLANFYQCSPNILIGYINMFMMKYDDSANNHCSVHTWYPGQRYVQTGLVLLAVVCIFWLLLAKPLVMLSRLRHTYRVLPAIDVKESEVIEMTDIATPPLATAHLENEAEMIEMADTATPPLASAHLKNEAEVIEKTDIAAPLLETSHLQNEAQVETTTVKMDKSHDEYLKQFTKPLPEAEHIDVGEAFIHQTIHMIEFCLGCISHTASYLRLWALSLAHAQLSDVLWDMVLRNGFAMSLGMGIQVVLIYVLVCPFAVLTVVILLIMEGLSAFLHTLRLHWVEFNSKFYYGDGFPFQPLSFYEIIHARDD